jgi:hypothetical protein
MKPAFEPHKIQAFRTLHDWVVVQDMQFDERITSSGIVLLNDNGKGTGIRPRWGRVYAVGPEQTAVSAGQWICVAHGRWTRGVRVEDERGETTLRKIDPQDILLVSDEQPEDDTMSNAIHVEQRTR